MAIVSRFAFTTKKTKRFLQMEEFLNIYVINVILKSKMKIMKNKFGKDSVFDATEEELAAVVAKIMDDKFVPISDFLGFYPPKGDTQYLIRGPIVFTSVLLGLVNL